MAANGVKEAPKNLDIPDIPSITILDSDDEEEQTTDELFEGFMKAIKPFLMRKELLLLRVKFQALSPDFKSSSRFKDMLRRKANQVHKVDVYIHFNEILDAVIRNAAVYGRKGVKTTEEKELSDDNKSTGLDETTQLDSRQECLAGTFENVEEGSPMETSLNQSNESVDNDIQLVEVINPSHSSSSGDFQNANSSKEKRNIEQEKMKLKRKKLIAKLEAKLKYISDEIKRLSQAELSLEEMEYGDSSYIMENRLKKRFNTIWNKICKLKGRPTNTGRVIEGSIKCKTSGFPNIDKAIGKFLKKRQGFPDIFDIRNIVLRVNKKHGLGITQGVQNDIAADILTDIGNKLQKKRKKDFEYNFGCHLTDDCLPSLDPALNNGALRQKLEENKKVSENALDNVFQKYVHLGRVKGTRDNGTDSKTTTESDTESEKELQPGKRKITKEKEHSSERGSEDESCKKRKRKKISSENKEMSSVDISVIPTTSATDIPTTSTKSNAMEVENSPSNDENSTVTSNGEQPLLSKTTASMVQTSVPEVDEPGSLEVEESAELSSKHSSKLQANQDLSSVDDIVKIEVQNVPITLNSSESEKEKPQIETPPQISKSKPEINTTQKRTNGFGHDDVIEIISNDGDSVGSNDNRDKIEHDKRLQQRKLAINSTKLLVKIQQLKENQLSKYKINKPLTVTSVSVSNEKIDSCHSKRKAVLVRHITHNQDHSHSSPSNGISDKQVSCYNKVEQVKESERRSSRSGLKISPTSTTTSESPPVKGISDLQESLKNCPSNNVKNNSILQSNNILTTTQTHRFSDTSEKRSSSPKVKISTMSSKFSPHSKQNLSKKIETVIILSDDEDN